MNNNRTKQHRKGKEAIAELECLSQSDGYIYTFCGLVLNSLYMSPDEIADVDWDQRLNYQELAFLLGLMVKRPVSLALPSTSEGSDRRFNATLDLFRDLHVAHVYSVESLAFETQQSLEVRAKEYVQSYDGWMESGRGMVEPIFYGGEGAYDFQYLEMAERRYRDDKNWLAHHLGTSFDSVLEIARQLTKLSTARLSSMCFEGSYEDFFSHCLEIFSFSPHDITGVADEAIDSFFQAFSLLPGEVNEDLKGVGDFNKACSHPVIRLEHNRFFLPMPLKLAESIYESPFYWMLEDTDYKETAFSNRGMATEKIAYELLKQVFNEGRVYRGVNVTDGKDDVTDIDVLAVEGSKAIIVQAKSKKLTVNSRRGDGKRLKSDFRGAVQEAYDQALLSRKAVLERGASLSIDGKRIDQDLEAVDEAYIICLTGDHYPAVMLQLESYLQKEETDPYPVAMSIFDLDIVTFYLEDPFDLLYYLRQRTIHATHFKTDSEISLLAFHLSCKLVPPEQLSGTLVAPGYAQLIDAHFPAVHGQWPESGASDRLFHQWRNERYETLLAEVKMIDDPNRLDVVFLLYDLAGSRGDTLFEGVDRVRQLTLQDNGIHIASVFLSDGKRGISFVSSPRPSCFKEARLFQEQFEGLAEAERHKNKADEWLAFASFADSSLSYDLLCHNRETWRPDSNLDNLAKTLLKSQRHIDVQGRKIGRNDPCPCGSGLKYKRCHG